MESLKELLEICKPDIRQKFFGIIEPGVPDGIRPTQLEDFYDDARAIELHANVPEEVRNHFETARNLIIYSWFYYPFNVTAELCAYISAEFALRVKTQDQRRPFKMLLQEAVQKKWIRDDGFSHIKRRYQRLLESNANMPPEYQCQLKPLEQEYCATLTRVLPSLRNSLTHGSSILHNNGVATVRICAELINQLFAVPDDGQKITPST